jgi:chorismate mutase
MANDKKLIEIREDVSALDEEILGLLVKRMQLVTQLSTEKKRQKMAVFNEGQNEVVVQRAIERANELNIDTGAVKEIFTVILRMSIDKQRELSGESSKLP